MRSNDTFLTDIRRVRLLSHPVEMCGAALDIMGQRLVPDESKGYVEFQISQGLQVNPGSGELVGLNAYHTCQHPQTIANSHGSMLHQVFNRDHKMVANDPEGNIARDHIIGAVVGVEFPKSPTGGQWKVQAAGKVNPQIRAAAVLHKKAEGVSRMLGEHLTGKHTWMVSHELNYPLVASGFVVRQPNNADNGWSAATKEQRDLLAQLTPDEFSGVGLGYIPAIRDGEVVAPEELLECYDQKKRMVNKPWGKLQVALLAGGIAGTNHYQGVGMVRYGAERNAEIQQILASHPDAIYELEADGLIEMLAALRAAVDKIEEYALKAGEK